MRPELILFDAPKSPTTEAIDALEKPEQKDPTDVSNAVLDRFEASNIRYKCRSANCHLLFKRKDQLHAHEFTHTSKKIFACPSESCPKSYLSNAHLKRHILTAHQTLQTESIPCKFGPPCTRTYKSKQKMLYHYQQVHIDKTDIKTLSFKCDLCPAVFRRKAQHRFHMFSHTGNYPYTCQHCQRGFMNRYQLVRHENSHRIHKCEECGRDFVKWSLLVAHRHAEHANDGAKCNICGRQFQSKRGLRHHRSVHEDKSDREVLQCPFEKCPNFFYHQKNLNAHIRTKHEGNKFICDFDGCGKTLCSKQKLLQHMQVIHLNVNNSKKSGTKQAVRKPRKDKGVPKESTAAKLAQIVLPKEIDEVVLAGQGHTIQFEYESASELEESFEVSDERKLG